MINQDLKSQLLNAGYTGEMELSELIEACGDDFDSLSKDEKWLAFSKIEGFDPEYGSTPEEAVARLWLALQE